MAGPDCTESEQGYDQAEGARELAMVPVPRRCELTCHSPAPVHCNGGLPESKIPIWTLMPLHVAQEAAVEGAAEERTSVTDHQELSVGKTLGM